MAKSHARIRRLEFNDEIRKRIRTSMILNRLSDHIDGKVELSSTQVRAAEILLRKSIPDLSSTELTGNPESPVEVGISKRPTMSREEWLKSHGLGPTARPAN